MNGQALHVPAPLLADLASVLDCIKDVEECQLNKDKSAGLQESVSRGQRTSVGGCNSLNLFTTDCLFNVTESYRPTVYLRDPATRGPTAQNACPRFARSLRSLPCKPATLSAARRRGKKRGKRARGPKRKGEGGDGCVSLWCVSHQLNT